MCVTHLAHDVIDVIAIAMYTYADEKVVVLAPWWWVGNNRPRLPWLTKLREIIIKTLSRREIESVYGGVYKKKKVCTGSKYMGDSMYEDFHRYVQ